MRQNKRRFWTLSYLRGSAVVTDRIWLLLREVPSVWWTLLTQGGE